MIELRFVKRQVKIDPFYKPNSFYVHVLQYREIQNPLEIGLHPAIYSEWQDVPIVEEQDNQ